MIEGAPSMLDFDHFLADLKDFDARTARLLTRRRINTPAPAAGPAGFGRVDAFGHIFNQVVVEHLGNPESENTTPDAPASYPALWDIAQHPFVQWNYSAPNLGVGQQARFSTP